MNALAPFRPDLPAVPAPIRVIGRVRPFSMVLHEFERPAGETLMQILEFGFCGPLPPADRMRVRVAIEGMPIRRELWHRVRPNPGRLVEVVVTPAGGLGGGGGGKKSPLRIVLSLAIAAAAAWAGPVLAPGLLGGLGIAASPTALSIAGGLITGAIGLVGSAALNALVPPPSANLPGLGGAPRGAFSPASQVYAISGASNQTTKWSPIPVVLGVGVPVWWPYGAAWYTELEGDDQYVRMLFLLHGPLEVSAPRFGTTPVAEFDAEVAVNGVAWDGTGTASGGLDGADLAGALTLFSNDVAEINVGVALEPGSPATRNTVANTDEALLDIVFGNGIVFIDNLGGSSAVTVQVKVSWRPASGGAWTDETLTWTENSRSAVRRGHRIVFPSRGDWSVQCERLDGTFDGTNNNGFPLPSVWTVLRSVRRESPLALPAGRTFSTIEMRVKASALGNGALDTFNCLCSSIVPDWDAGSQTWVDGTTDNCASLYRYVAMGAPARRPRTAAQVTAQDLVDWWERCDANGYRFNAVIADRRPVFEMLRNIASFGRAAVGRDGTRLSVVMDRPQTVRRQLFTPYNTWGLKGERSLKRLPKGLRVRFVNPEADGQADERLVPADGYTESQVDDAEVLDLTEGCQDPDQAFDQARYFQRVAKLRPEVIKFNCDPEYLLAKRGELAGLAHDVMLVGLDQGRLKAVTETAEDGVTAVTLDKPVTIEAGKTYGVTVRGKLGAVDTRQVTAAPGAQTVLTVVAPPPYQQWRRGDLFAFGISGSEVFDVVVHKWEPGPDLSCLVTVHPAGQAVHDDGPIPQWDSGITIPAASSLKPAAPVIESVRSDESAMVRDPGGALRPRIVVALKPRMDPQGREATALLAYSGLAGGSYGSPRIHPPSATEIVIDPAIEGQGYDLRIVAERIGKLSDPVQILGHVVVGQSSLPPTPVLIRAGDRIDAPDYPELVDLAGFAIRTQAGDGTPDWTRATPAHPASTLVALPFPLAELGEGQRTVLVRAVDQGGRESAIGSLVVNLSSPATRNLIWSRDLDAEGWPGTLSAGEIDEGALKGSDSDDGWWPATDAEPFWPASDAAEFWAPVWSDVVYAVLITVPEAGRLLVPAGLTAPQGWRLRIRPEGDSAFWPANDGDAFWPANDGDAFWPDVTGPWADWPGSMEIAAGAWQLRLDVYGGGERQSVASMAALLDLPDQVELVTALAVAIGGTAVPLTLSYRSFKSVQPTLVADGGAAVSTRVKVMDPPEIEALDGANASVAGTVNVQITGVAA